MPEPKNILVIDNDRSTRNLIQKLLKSYLVETASSKVMALELLDSRKFDLVIVDVIIDGASSSGLIEKIKFLNAKLPVLVTTSTHDIEQALEAVKRGAANYIIKPKGLETIQNIVRKTLNTEEIFTKYQITNQYIKTCHEIEMPSTLAHIKGIIYYFLERTPLKDGNPTDFIFPVQISVQEALINAVIHGNQLNPEKKVYIKALMDHEHFEITIRDEGKGFNQEVVSNPTDELAALKEHGRGIFLMRCYMDQVQFKQSGREVYMIKRNPATSTLLRRG